MLDTVSSEVLFDLDVRNKRDLLRLLAGEAARRVGIAEEDILGALLAREELGSTALGKGVALPHAVLDGEFRPILLLCRLLRPIEFDARDGEAVDLVALFLWPKPATKTLLDTMAKLCGALRQPEVLRKLRAAEAPDGAEGALRAGLAAAAPTGHSEN